VNYPEKIDVGWIDPGYVTGHFAHSISSSIAQMQYHECFGNVHRLSSSLPTAGRNLLVDEFLKGDSDWLWMVDADMVFDQGHPMKLWEAASDNDAEMVSGLAFIFWENKQPVPSYFLEDEHGALNIVYNAIPDSACEVAATGLASSLIHRKVFEALTPPRHPKYRWFDQIELIANVEGLSGEDTQFFVRAREAGFKLILEPTAETWHVKNVGIGKADFYRFWELFGRPVKSEDGISLA
jgi:GT2 family glycosyltransferase